MLAVAQAGEHRAGFGPVARFAERLAVEIDDRIGGDDQGFSRFRTVGFAPRMGSCELARREMRKRTFIVSRGYDVDGQT
jgi:hypothetical protein